MDLIAVGEQLVKDVKDLVDRYQIFLQGAKQYLGVHRKDSKEYRY